jgi:hypothetical protein
MLAALGLGVGCSGGGNTDGGADANPQDGTMNGDATDHVVTPDVHDSGPADTGVPLFQPCTSTAMCTGLGTGAMCITQFPGGICTRRCTTDHNCGPTGSGICLQGVCFPQCQQGDSSCDQYGADCVVVDPADPTRRICNPSCFPSGSTPPSASYPMCPASAACDPYTGACSAMPVTMGAVDGAPCMADTDCRGGRCILENDPMNGPSGFIGGYCISFGYRPADSAYAMGQPIPQGNCPMGSGPFPFSDTMVSDGTACLATCDTSHPCRAGYTCDHLQSTMTHMPFFTNGFCLPVDCNMTGMSCPSGYHCVTQPSDAAMPPGQCEAGGTDGGVVDAGVDVPVVDVPLGG